MGCSRESDGSDEEHASESAERAVAAIGGTRKDDRVGLCRKVELLLTQFPSTLLELSTSDKPIWVYFDSQHKHILQRVKGVYDVALVKVIGKCPFSLRNFGSSSARSAKPAIPRSRTTGEDRCITGNRGCCSRWTYC
jgi:hypothetical protein